MPKNYSNFLQMDYYDLLGVERNCSADELTVAYRKTLVKLNRWSDSPECETAQQHGKESSSSADGDIFPVKPNDLTELAKRLQIARGILREDGSRAEYNHACGFEIVKEVSPPKTNDYYDLLGIKPGFSLLDLEQVYKANIAKLENYLDQANRLDEDCLKREQKQEETTRKRKYAVATLERESFSDNAPPSVRGQDSEDKPATVDCDGTHLCSAELKKIIKRINLAYKTLRDPGLRREYNETIKKDKSSEHYLYIRAREERFEASCNFTKVFSSLTLKDHVDIVRQGNNFVLEPLQSLDPSKRTDDGIIEILDKINGMLSRISDGETTEECSQDKDNYNKATRELNILKRKYIEQYHASALDQLEEICISEKMSSNNMKAIMGLVKGIFGLSLEQVVNIDSDPVKVQDIRQQIQSKVKALHAEVRECCVKECRIKHGKLLAIIIRILRYCGLIDNSPLQNKLDNYSSSFFSEKRGAMFQSVRVPAGKSLSVAAR